MATIYGVQLKGIKTWTGMEGYGVEANIYIDGKKRGRYYDPADGSKPESTFDNPAHEQILKDRAKAYFAKHPPIYEGSKDPDFYDFLTDGDALIEEILRLTEEEKQHKKVAKEGYPVMVQTDFPLFAHCPKPLPQCMAFCGENARENAARWVQEQQAKHPGLFARTYTSLDDFNIKEGE